MFNPVILKELADANKQGFSKLVRLEERLRGRFVGLEEPIRALILAVATGEPLLFIGPPGTAKSRLVHSLCEITGIYDPNSENKQEGYFEYLLTQFTEPSELFGFYDLSKLHGETPELVRLEKGMLQRAEVVFLDEVFNGSSAILNSLLAIMNERRFHDRGKRQKVPLKNLFAATNHVPTNKTLAAVYDRFVIRCHVDSIFDQFDAVTSELPQSIQALAEGGWKETYAGQSAKGDISGVFRAMTDLREMIRKATGEGRLAPVKEHPVYRNLAYLTELLRTRNLTSLSNRRLIKLSYVMLVHRLYRAVFENQMVNLDIGQPELDLLCKYFVDSPKDIHEPGLCWIFNNCLKPCRSNASQHTHSSPLVLAAVVR